MEFLCSDLRHSAGFVSRVLRLCGSFGFVETSASCVLRLCVVLRLRVCCCFVVSSASWELPLRVCFCFVGVWLCGGLASVRGFGFRVWLRLCVWLCFVCSASFVLLRLFCFVGAWVLCVVLLRLSFCFVCGSTLWVFWFSVSCEVLLRGELLNCGYCSASWLRSIAFADAAGSQCRVAVKRAGIFQYHHHRDPHQEAWPGCSGNCHPK